MVTLLWITCSISIPEALKIAVMNNSCAKRQVFYKMVVHMHVFCGGLTFWVIFVVGLKYRAWITHMCIVLNNICMLVFRMYVSDICISALQILFALAVSVVYMDFSYQIKVSSDIHLFTFLSIALALDARRWPNGRVHHTICYFTNVWLSTCTYHLNQKFTTAHWTWTLQTIHSSSRFTRHSAMDCESFVRSLQNVIVRPYSMLPPWSCT